MKGKWILISSGLTILALYLEWMRFSVGCGGWRIADLPWCLTMSMFLIIFLPISIIGWVVQRLSDSIYSQWLNFTFIYLSIYLFIYLIMPQTTDFLNPFRRENVVIASLILYPILSIIVILIAKKKQKSS